MLVLRGSSCSVLELDYLYWAKLLFHSRLNLLVLKSRREFGNLFWAKRLDHTLGNKRVLPYCSYAHIYHMLLSPYHLSRTYLISPLIFSGMPQAKLKLAQFALEHS